jgi:hypothetical protein
VLFLPALAQRGIGKGRWFQAPMSARCLGSNIGCMFRRAPLRGLSISPYPAHAVR